MGAILEKRFVVVNSDNQPRRLLSGGRATQSQFKPFDGSRIFHGLQINPGGDFRSSIQPRKEGKKTDGVSSVFPFKSFSVFSVAFHG
jgi:hypothetical protein